MPSALVGRPGEDVEAVVSMLLCRQHDRAARRRPGQGDRGIDVFVPLDDGRIDVYQVKRYDRSLTPTQWRRVRESYDTLVDAVRQGLQVRNWYLVLPLDPSEADESKFTALVADGPFEHCEWKGLAWLDALAAQYPEVVDYYLGDGKQRLGQLHRDLLTVLRARDSAQVEADTKVVGQGLVALHHALNEHDPLYWYDFAVHKDQGSGEDTVLRTDPPETLVSTARLTYEGVSVTWDIHARCAESLRERPIPIGVSFDARDPDLQDALRRFSEYGAPFAAPDGSATVTVDLPGGLGVENAPGAVRFGPATQPSAGPYLLRLRATRLGEPPLVVRVNMQTPTVGSRGVRLSGEHDGGAFSFQALNDFEPPNMHVSFAGLDPTGRPVAGVLEGVEFLLALPASALEIGAEHGPFIPLGEGPRSASGVKDPNEDLEVAALRALHEIQQHTPATVLVPDFNQVTKGQLREWQIIARLLRGETVNDERLGVLTTNLEEAPEHPVDGVCQFAISGDLVADVAGHQVVLGQQILSVASATVSHDSADPRRVTVTPSEGHTWTRRLGGSPDCDAMS